MTNLTKYTPDDIADYFLALSEEEIGDLLSNLKLQKLVYYAQGIAISVRDEVFFDEQLEAWQHGPVVPTLYHKYKKYGGKSIEEIERIDLAKYTQADRMILDDVYAWYGQFSAWKLRDMTHEEDPWQKACKKAEHELSLEDLKNYFDAQISEQYKKKYWEKAEAQSQ